MTSTDLPPPAASDADAADAPVIVSAPTSASLRAARRDLFARRLMELHEQVYALAIETVKLAREEGEALPRTRLGTLMMSLIGAYMKLEQKVEELAADGGRDG